MRETTPLVSIIITTYKRPVKLKRAIDSVLEQSYPNLEIIVVDDNDADTKYRRETEDLMNDYKNNSLVKYIKHANNKNGAAARNTGIKYSKGKYLTFLDDDDIYFKEKVFKQVKYLEENDEFDGVYCGWKEGEKEFYPKHEGDITFYILQGSENIITNSIMVTRTSTISISGWDETFQRSQEAAFLLRFFKGGFKIAKIPELLFERDMEDRSNAATSKSNEKIIDYFLDAHKSQITQSSIKLNKKEDEIYSYRYRAVFLTYLKNKDYKDAIYYYIKVMKKVPVKFNKDLIVYSVSKLLKIKN